MKPASFKYIAACSLEEALAAKAAYRDEARFLAGGQSLVPTMNFRLATPAVLIDINALSEIDGVTRRDGIHIGAMTRYRTLEADPLIGESQPILIEALPHIAHPQIRNRGTLGGNLCHADPASEMPAIMLALGARLKGQSESGERWIDASVFFTGLLQTDLRDDEMLTAIELPDLPPRTGVCFLEVSRRRGDFAMMGIAVAITLDADGICSAARLAYCGAGATPVLAVAASDSLVGGEISEAAIDEAAALSQRAIDPLGSIHASKAYQRHLAGVLTRRAVSIAKARCGH